MSAVVDSLGRVEIAWDSSPSDVTRPSPTSLDFTAGGSFANVNDVAAYTVWRYEAGLEVVQVGAVPAGQTSFVDMTLVGSPTYSVIAEDASGNRSPPASAPPMPLGPPPIARYAFGPFDFGDVAADSAVILGPVFILNDAQATGEAAATPLNVLLRVDGAGFSVTPSMLSIEGGASGPGITVGFSATEVGNFEGTYHGVLTVTTNDPRRTSMAIQLSAQISHGLAAPDIDVTPPALAFSKRRLIGTVGTKRIALNNRGRLPLTGSFTVEGTPFSSPDSATFRLAPSESAYISIRFLPTEPGNYTGRISVSSNDPDQPLVTVDLSGGGVDVIYGIDPIPVSPKATLTFENSIDLDFADQAAVDAFAADLVQVLATRLAITPSRIRVLSIVEGSIVVTFTISRSAAGEPSAAEALDLLQSAIADTTTAPLADLPAVEGLDIDTTPGAILAPLDPRDDPVLGWFTRSEDRVGFNDFFAFADNFGLQKSDATYDEAFDIWPVDNPDGRIDFDDFFLFTDYFGTVVANADEIRAVLE